MLIFFRLTAYQWNFFEAQWIERNAGLFYTLGVSQDPREWKSSKKWKQIYSVNRKKTKTSALTFPIDELINENFTWKSLKH